MALTFQELTRLITNGEPVDEATINRVLSQLDANTKYVLSLIEAANTSSAIFARQVTVDASTTVGTPVYWDGALQRFMPAIAEADTDAQGNFIASEKSQVWGVVYAKHNTTSADLLIDGYASLDLSGVTSPLENGTYYLSGSAAGKLVRQKQPVTVPVLQHADGKVNVRIRFYDPASEHKHYQFPLQAVPAGETSPPDTANDPHEITNPDPDVEGWLPADHAIFEGLAPAGAVFGYNLAASSLRDLWPPVPLPSASLTWDRGLDSEIGGTTVLSTGAGHARIDQNGIWWMTDCYGEVPWPSDWDSNSPPTPPTSPTCPHANPMTLTLWFTRMQAATTGTVVTSLRGDASGRLKVVCAGDSGQLKTTGDLQLELDLELATHPEDDEPGALVFKRLDADGVFHRGPVVSGAVSTNPKLSVVGTLADGGFQRGDLTFNLADTPVGQAFQIEAVRLGGSATQQNYLDTVAYGLAAGRKSALRCRFTIPATFQGVSQLGISLQFVFLARAAGNLPDLNLSYRRIPTLPVGSKKAIPVADSSLSIDMSPGAGITQDQYVAIASDSLTAEPGDVILFTLERDAESGDGFSGDIFLLGMSAPIVSITP